MEEEFNKVGLTICVSVNKRMVLCTIDEDNKPKVSKILEDYMFIGSENNPDKVLEERLVNCLISFIEKVATHEAKKT